MMERWTASSPSRGRRVAHAAILTGHDLPLFRLAQEYTLADQFFHAAFGGGFLNHLWLICACTPRFDDAPADLIASVDTNGRLTRDGAMITT